MENGPADFVKAVFLPSCFLLGGLHMKGGELKEAYGKDDVEITLVNLGN